jgi:recombinational DNA repair protein (RecF pathway)
MAGEGDPQPRLFAWWAAALKKLSVEPEPFRPDLGMDLELLSLLGHGPRWDVCTECSRAPEGESLFFSFERGGISCASCRKPGEGRWLPSRIVESFRIGGEPPGVARNDARRALDDFVSYTLGREPKSRRFRDEVMGGAGA